ncbi:MAG: hypothetical protein HN923_07570 [Euryarchaeota archaeon]|nr:hypothetical protein [Euryarchaeota archaeon]
MKQQPSIMAEPREVVERSFNINKKLGPRLIEAAKQDAILRIGWTSAGDPVPKNGELGLCPNLPAGSRMRALGLLGSWVAAFGGGGNFTIQGDVGSFLGAGNRGNTIVCEQIAGNFAGYAMRSGKISIMDGAGNDAGAMMNGGLLLIRGSVGERVGGGMKDGIIVVHGDVGLDPGAGMVGGKIIINGRYPSRLPSGVEQRLLTAAEVKSINSQLDNEGMEIPKDAACLVPSECLRVEATEIPVSSSDLSSIGLVAGDLHHIAPYQSCDTAVLVPENDDANNPIAFPIPLLPIISSGEFLQPTNEMDHIAIQVLAKQPFITREQPRLVDFSLIDTSNLADAPELLENSSGMVVDLDDLPAMNSEEIDGFIVATRTLLGMEKPISFLNSISRVESLHVRSSHHNVDLAISRIEDGSGIAEAAALPMIGRSTKSHLSDTATQTGMLLGLSASGQDLAILRASGIDLICCEVPMQDAQDLAHWLHSVSNELTAILRRLGLDSIEHLKRQHLRALDYETASISGLRLVGYDRPLPHWFAR